VPRNYWRMQRSSRLDERTPPAGWALKAEYRLCEQITAATGYKLDSMLALNEILDGSK